MIKIKSIVSIGVLAILIIISTSWVKNNENKQNVNGEDTTMVYNRHLMMAVLYQQRAAECKALYFQAFNIAQMMLDLDLNKKEIKGKRAIIVDIDETILDNSPFEGKMITKNGKFPDDWNQWVELAKAKAVPGAVDFLNYAAKKGAEVFYITNRTQSEATIRNLKDQKFPMADTIHLMVKKGSENSKEIRRKKVMENYHVVLLMGDNLSDFAEVFDVNTPENRESKTNVFRKEFGRRFIVLPNAMYGDWERAMYENSPNHSKKEKAEIRKSNVIDF